MYSLSWATHGKAKKLLIEIRHSLKLIVVVLMVNQLFLKTQSCIGFIEIKTVPTNSNSVMECCYLISWPWFFFLFRGHHSATRVVTFWYWTLSVCTILPSFTFLTLPATYKEFSPCYKTSITHTTHISCIRVDNVIRSICNLSWTSISTNFQSVFINKWFTALFNFQLDLSLDFTAFVDEQFVGGK